MRSTINFFLILLLFPMILCACADKADTSKADGVSSSGGYQYSYSADSSVTDDEVDREYLQFMCEKIKKLGYCADIIDIIDHGNYLEVIVYSHEDVEALEKHLLDEKMNMKGIMIHVSYEYLAPKPNHSGELIRDIETIDELLNIYKEELCYRSISELKGEILVELESVGDSDIRTVQKYLERCGVDMSIVTVYIPERFNT